MVISQIKKVNSLQSKAKYTIASDENLYSFFILECLSNHVKIIKKKKIKKEKYYLKKFIELDFNSLNSIKKLKKLIYMNRSKIILGINAFHADSSACLIIDGKLIVALEEERINRVKHYSGFPYNAIKECLSIGGIDEKDITDIAFNTNLLAT